MAARKYHLSVGIIVYIAFSIAYYYWLLSIPIYIPASLLGVTGLPTWFPIPLPRTLSSADPIYLVVALLLVLVGSEIADYDKAVAWMQHRDWLTHSCIIPGILSAIVMVFTVIKVGNPIQTLLFNPAVNTVLLLGMSVFALGAASHLFLDYFPPIKEAELHNKKGSLTAGHELADFYVSGMTGQELFRRLQGTALVHFWWTVSMPKEEKKKKTKQEKYAMRRTLDSKQSQAYYLTNGIILLLIAGLLFLQYFLIQAITMVQQYLILLPI